MTPLTLKEAATTLGYKLKSPDMSLSGVFTDTRVMEKDGIFVALTGENFDGHDYVNTAFQKGAVLAVVSEQRPDYQGEIVLVEDTRKALLLLAGQYRTHWSNPLVAVTGSVGKTTTKDMIGCVLDTTGNTLKTKKNLNNEVGLSQMLFSLTEEHKSAVLEIGVDGPEQMLPMTLAAAPTVGVITNIGGSHLEAFQTKNAIAKEKLTLAKGLSSEGTLLLNGDDPLLKSAASLSNTKFYSLEDSTAFVFAKVIEKRKSGQVLEVLYHKKKYQINLPALGIHNAQNALAAFGAGVLVGISPTLAAAALENYTPTGMRQNMVEHKGRTFVEDCYNASPQSMKSAAKTLGEMKPSGRKIMIVSDMLELGPTEKEIHFSTGQFIAKAGVDMLLSTGPLSQKMNLGAINKNISEAKQFETKEDLADYILTIAQPGDILWFKASRGMRLEDVIHKIYEEMV